MLCIHRHRLIDMLLVAMLASATTQAAAPAAVSQTDALAGLKAALTQAATTAVASLGKPDGFLGNPEVHIPLPGKLQDAQKMLKMVGLGSQADELEQTMNRAAEAAVPEARTMLVDAAQAGKFGLVDARDASVESYVTAKALDGLYLMMAREEKAIRQDPLGQASTLLRKVFGSLSR